MTKSEVHYLLPSGRYLPTSLTDPFPRDVLSFRKFAYADNTSTVTAYSVDVNAYANTAGAEIEIDVHFSDTDGHLSYCVPSVTTGVAEERRKFRPWAGSLDDLQQLINSLQTAHDLARDAALDMAARAKEYVESTDGSQDKDGDDDFPF